MCRVFKKRMQHQYANNHHIEVHNHLNMTKTCKRRVLKRLERVSPTTIFDNDNDAIDGFVKLEQYSSCNRVVSIANLESCNQVYVCVCVCIYVCVTLYICVSLYIGT